jgi:cold shock CspA family protein
MPRASVKKLAFEISLEVTQMETLGRFSGTVKRVGPKFGYITMDDSKTDVWFHRDICEDIDFDNIAVGDRLTFQIVESKTYAGQLAAGRITREKVGTKFHAPKPRENSSDGTAKPKQNCY